MDVYSDHYHFTYKGRAKYKTIFGGLLTAISVITITIFFFILGRDILYKLNPSVTTIEEFLVNPPTSLFNLEDTILAIDVKHIDFSEMDHKQFITIIPSLIQKITIDKKDVIRRKNLELVKCPETIKELNTNLPKLNELICIKKQNYYLSGGFDKEFDNYLEFKIYTCKNETIKGENLSNNSTLDDFELKYMTKFYDDHRLNLKTLSKFKDINDFTYDIRNCKSPEEIKNKKGFSINFFVGGYKIDPTKYQDPLKPYVHKIQSYIDPFLSKTITLYYETYTIINDSNWVFNDLIEIDRKIGFTNYISDYDTIENGQLTVNLEITGRKKTIMRTYIKIQNIFANLGGLIQSISLIFGIIIYLFQQKMINKKIISKLFEINEDSNDENEINNNNININNMRSELKVINKSKINSNSINSFIDPEQKINDANNNNKNKSKNNNTINLTIKINKDSSRMKILKENEIINNKEIPNPDPDSNFNKNIKRNENNSNDEISKKILSKFFSKKKKLTTEGFESILITFFSCFISERLKRKNKLLDLYKTNLKYYTDFLEVIRNKREVSILKYFIFNKEQINSMSLIPNPRKDSEGNYIHHSMDFAKSISPLLKENKFTKLKDLKIFNENENSSNLDKKLFNVIDQDILKCLN
jgi:hypothetical protein